MREEKSKAAYLQDYHKCGSMSADREEVLLRAVQLGHTAKEQLQQHTVCIEDIAAAQRAVIAGEQAREELAISYLPMLALFARRYSYTSISMDDLMQEGAIGLLESIDSYRGGDLNFPAIITSKIKRAMGRLIAQKAAIKLPYHASSAIRKISAVSKCLERDTGHEPRAEDIAEEMVLPPAIVRKLLIYIRSTRASSLDAPVSDDPRGAVFGDMFAANEPTLEELAERWDLREQIQEILKTLEPVEESAIKLRFGFIGGEIYSAEETAEELMLPLDEEQRVEIKAMRKLRHPSRSSFLREYLYG